MICDSCQRRKVQAGYRRCRPCREAQPRVCATCDRVSGRYAQCSTCRANGIERMCATCERPATHGYLRCKRCREDARKIPCPRGCGRKMTPRAEACNACRLEDPPLGSDHPCWRGGVIIDGEGYVREYAPDHPRANMGRYVKQHHLVMERHLGRYLYPNENVHHKNGRRDDNRLENLELWIKPQPAGQRVEDIVDWAIEALARYRPEALATFVDKASHIEGPQPS